MTDNFWHYGDFRKGIAFTKEQKIIYEYPQFSPGAMMPIYEYFCVPCNTIFSFYAKTFSVDKEPACPRCTGKLQKYVSLFSLGHKLKGPEDLPMSSQRLEEGMKRLETFSEKDSKEAARLRKKFGEITGVSFDENKKKALAQKQDAEKPGQIDGSSQERFLGEQEAPPERDDNLYEL